MPPVLQTLTQWGPRKNCPCPPPFPPLPRPAPLPALLQARAFEVVPPQLPHPPSSNPLDIAAQGVQFLELTSPTLSLRDSETEAQRGPRGCVIPSVSSGPAQALGVHFAKRKQKSQTGHSPQPPKLGSSLHSASGPFKRLQESGNSSAGVGTGGREMVGRGQGSPLTGTCLSQLHTQVQPSH